MPPNQIFHFSTLSVEQILCPVPEATTSQPRQNGVVKYMRISEINQENMDMPNNKIDELLGDVSIPLFRFDPQFMVARSHQAKPNCSGCALSLGRLSSQ